MTYRQLHDQIVTRLKAAGCDDAAFDADCILEDVGGLPRAKRFRYWDEWVPDEVCFEVEQAAAQRMAGRPLQYILRHWDFLDLTLHVGEGVLIPRPETEQLCELGAEFLKKRPATARTWDLCAGTGCVGLGICRLRPGAHVTAVELSEAAAAYLRHNVADYPDYDVTVMMGDVLTDLPMPQPQADLIVSNPPYVPSGELDTLMREVRHEPHLALDGDTDGLKFYRALATLWAPKLTPGGMMAVEVGDGQADDVAERFLRAGLVRVQTHRDAAGTPRIVTARKPET